ncbi:threonyl-tRNA synthetase [Sulfobacillus acidophilus DSM 10332]|uniref:Threonine--tRNA ligase n=1 Tax=Sulfobacillus acidophilus (strain ATCC 700253 / DSM 10332 / NAL) TaxID=679936 RepID=G8TWG8_SULAD|nr:threonyl-tRNA synthetase [Sulfobacillus acidophilus DSM 10332]
MADHMAHHIRVEAGQRAEDVASIPAEAVAVWINGKVWDISRPLPESGELMWLTFEDSAGRHVFRHSSAHLLAQAVKRLWPDAKLGTGPALEDGFYYDIWLPEPLTEGDLPRIEAAIQEIVAEDFPVERMELSRDEALKLFEERGETFKLEIIRRIPDGAVISAYRQGEFIDLCSGPHVPHTGVLKAVKLTQVSGAYWRGDEKNPMMTRIYGTSFPDAEQLERHLQQIEEAKQRDHRKLGAQLDLFTFREEAPGFVFWHPKGHQLYRTLEDFSRRLQQERGYQEVATPWIYRVGLWERSGHWDHYRDNLFLIERDDELQGVKPMNCPGHALLFKGTTRSYRDLPWRLAEYSPLSRFERSGTLHGLMRVRGFHQDDAHLFVRPDQIQSEMFGVLDLVDLVYRAFNMPYEVVLSTRPDDYMGDLALWERAEAELESVLKARGLRYQINPKDGAFYGPKLDVYAVDSLGRRWQCATAQLDFQLPEKFELEYVDQDGQPKRPVMIHRAIMGSLERFIGILVEHYAGAFPFWLAPLQVMVLPITDRQLPYAEAVQKALVAAGIRAEVDRRNQKIGYKIREAQLQKVPEMLVVGARDEENQTVSVRIRELGDVGAKPWPAYLDELRLKAGQIWD